MAKFEHRPDYPLVPDDVLRLDITRPMFDALAEVLNDTDFRDGADRVRLSLYEIEPGVAFIATARDWHFYKTRRGFLRWLFGGRGL